MSPGFSAVLSAALIVGSTAALRRAVHRPHITITEIRARLTPPRPRYGLSPTPEGRVRWSGTLAGRVAAGPVGRWIQDRLGPALLLADTTVATVTGRMIAAAAMGAGAVLLAAVGLAAARIVPLGWAWLPIAATTILAFAGVAVRDVRVRADRRRRELAQVVNDFVQLVAVGLTTNRSVEEAIGFAADAGDGFGFDLLRRTIATADPMGVPVWTALTGLALEYGLDDLRGLCSSLEHQAAAGVSVAGTIRTEAKALRAKHLTALAEQADRANANLQLPTMGMVFGMVAFLLYPIARQITTAFT